tara:strand:+ start:744 stop:1109 length:366 start_codon:yes stop_codon:yes gene_type:complete
MNKHRGSDFNEFLIEQGLTNTDHPMTPTPRTDEAADRFPQPGQPPGAQWPEIVPAEFARQLERELAAERELADRLAAFIQLHRDGYGGQVVDPECNCCDCEYLGTVDEALAAWKEARHGTH